jgi:hypothetical protein
MNKSHYVNVYVNQDCRIAIESSNIQRFKGLRGVCLELFYRYIT